MYGIKIKNIGKDAITLKVSHGSNKRVASFETFFDANEAIRVINTLRTDSAYQGCEIFNILNGNFVIRTYEYDPQS